MKKGHTSPSLPSDCALISSTPINEDPIVPDTGIFVINLTQPNLGNEDFTIEYTGNEFCSSPESTDSDYQRSNSGKDEISHTSAICLVDDMDKGVSKNSIALPITPERWPRMTVQMAIPLFLAGLGMTGAGLLLDEVMTWKVFIAITDLIFLVTPLLGLKGDLEMTLASRLSTHANLGRMKTKKETWNICFANLCLDQLQAIVCGFLAALLAMSMGAILAGETFHYNNAVLLCASSCTTASIVSIVLGSTMCTVIITANKANCNPDNIATPVAGSLGDVVTLGSLALIGSFLFLIRDEYPWIPYIFLGASVITVPFCGMVAYRNENTRTILTSGWAPVLASVVISSGGGLILEQSSSKYPSMALYQPLINGIGGNMVCILASRLATQLHRDCVSPILPGKSQSICISPISVFFGKGERPTAARVLMILVCPLQLAFVTIIYFSSDLSLFNVKFLAVFEAASFLQLLILLYTARILVNFNWKRGWDPDTSSIPYLMAFGDLVGSGLLLLAFMAYEL